MHVIPDDGDFVVVRDPAGNLVLHGPGRRRGSTDAETSWAKSLISAC